MGLHPALPAGPATRREERMTEPSAGSDPAGGTDGGPTRRGFMNACLAGGALATGGMVTYPLARFLLPPDIAEAAVASVVAGRVDEFPLNSGKVFKMGSKPGLLVRLQTGEFKAFSAVCTHLSCRVKFVPDTKVIFCNCHGGVFDLTGKNIGGPPPKPLEEFTANVRGDEVSVCRAT